MPIRCYYRNMIYKNTSMKTSTPIIKPRTDRKESIALVGLMGSGKSVLGRRLAKQLQLKFFDSDQLVTKMAGISIRDIFDLAGEAKFRDMEFRVIQEQMQILPHVLATGGGAFCDPRTSLLSVSYTHLTLPTIE